MALERAALHAFLEQHRYGVISSVSAEGWPQSALVGIAVSPELEIIFDTLDTTRKYRNLRTDPRCSVVIGWPGERTCQVEGLARVPTGEDLKRCQDAYFGKWPDGLDRLHWPGLTHVAVRPTWARYSDYDQRPPLIEELTFRG